MKKVDWRMTIKRFYILNSPRVLTPLESPAALLFEQWGIVGNSGYLSCMSRS